MAKPNIIPTGSRFHRLTVLGLGHKDRSTYTYLCRCDCGTERTVNGTELRRGGTKSCGCLRRDHAATVGRQTKVRSDLTGQRFGRWTVIGRHGGPGQSRTLWLCRCDCGTEKPAEGSALKGGLSRSCGCLRLELMATRCITHGNAKVGRHTREYRIWQSMLNRCRRPQDISYKYYGGRGIRVCERWASFEDFLADMGPIPAPLSIDRVDNDGHYEPGNCRLATPKEQASNKRKPQRINK
jgi:hypothetical protein